MGYESPTFMESLRITRMNMKLSENGGTPKIIQVMDDHLNIESHGDFGIPPISSKPQAEETTSSKRPSLSAIRCTLPTLSGGAAKAASEK